MRVKDERFWDKVDASGDCWEWTGATAGRNIKYGQLSRSGRWWRAHRYAWTLLVADLPDELHIDHLCRNPLCVNPDHLEPVTQGENNRRGFGPVGINARKSSCNRGHPLSGDNLYVFPNGNRRCRACKNMMASRRRNKGA